MPSARDKQTNVGQKKRGQMEEQCCKRMADATPCQLGGENIPLPSFGALRKKLRRYVNNIILLVLTLFENRVKSQGGRGGNGQNYFSLVIPCWE